MQSMRIIDAHSHLYQGRRQLDRWPKTHKEIKSFDLNDFLRRLDETGISHVQIMPQCQERVQREWVGSNELVADIGKLAPTRIIPCVSGEPVDWKGCFYRAHFEEIKKYLVEEGLKGIGLAPPYGHWYSNDRRAYPFYELAVEVDVPIWFHHSHMWLTPKPPALQPPYYKVPLKYARIWILEDVLIDFPELRCVVEHMGYPWTEELLALMASHPNVYTDISLMIEPFGGRQQRRILLGTYLGWAREYGVLDRVMYGTDNPGYNLYGEQFSAEAYVSVVKKEVTFILEQLPESMERLGFPTLSQEETQGLLWRNAARFLKIQ